MRIYLYILAGITSALIGWNIGEFLFTDIGLFETAQLKEIIIFPCVAISLAIGMVSNEILLTTPTRIKLCWRRVKQAIPIALGLGLGLGLMAGILFEILFRLGNLPPLIVRSFSWVLVGIAVGLSEGLTWRWQSVEAGNKKRFQKRFIISLVGASIASLVGALVFEFIRLFGNLSIALRIIEEPIGFSLLGLSLGLTFSFTNSPSSVAALRAGTGFEYRDTFNDLDPNATIGVNYPCIDKSFLQLIGLSEENRIEEGLSIQLPSQGKIIIGSQNNKKAHIRLPEVPIHVAFLELVERKVILKPNPQAYFSITINEEKLGPRENRALKHNDVITFYTVKDKIINDEKIYRFVYYNRFLDPQA